MLTALQKLVRVPGDNLLNIQTDRQTDKQTDKNDSLVKKTDSQKSSDLTHKFLSAKIQMFQEENLWLLIHTQQRKL